MSLESSKLKQESYWILSPNLSTQIKKFFFVSCLVIARTLLKSIGLTFNEAQLKLAAILKMTCLSQSQQTQKKD